LFTARTIGRPDDEDHDVGFGDRRLRLTRHCGIDAGSLRLEPAGVDDDVRALV
jgi:hypothetical protein